MRKSHILQRLAWALLGGGLAVMGVTVEGTRKVGHDEGDADPARRHFRNLPGWRGTPEAQPVKGQGSGFIVSANGLILTNAHVVKDAKAVTVRMDAAVPFIRTDAAVNPGSSGGPLFDAAGNVVGIDAQIYSRIGGLQGVSFSIPVDLAMRVGRQIVATGRAQHAWLGVSVQDLTQPLANSFGLPRPDSALVAQVDPKSPAAVASLKPGVVILRIDGQPTVQAGALSARIAQAAQGDVVMAINGQPVDQIDALRRVLSTQPRSVALLIWRGGERLFVPVPLG